MRFLALATSDDDYFARLTAAEAAAGSTAEAARAQELYEAGIIRDISFRTDRRDVVIVLEVPDEDAARAALATLPFAAAGAISFEVIGLRPYDGWAGRPSRQATRNWWRWGRVELPVQNPSPETTTSVSDGLSSTARTGIGTLPGGPVTCP